MTSDDEDEDRATYGDERARGRRDDVGVERRMKGGYEYGGRGTRMGRAVVLGEGMGNAGRGRQRRQRRYQPIRTHYSGITWPSSRDVSN